jgi:hypothetical protein
MLLTLGLILLNVVRRRRLARAGEESEPASLPSLREDVLWGVLVLLGGGVGMGVILGLLEGFHTARALLAAVVLGFVMLFGLAMLLRNGLAPTDVLHLDASAPETADAAEESVLEDMAYEQQRLRLGSGPLG